MTELEKILKAPCPVPDPFRAVDCDAIALYGAGEMGSMAIDMLSQTSITPKYIVDSNLTGTLKGIRVIKPKDVPIEDRRELTFVICIASCPLTPIVKFLTNLGFIDIRHFYDLTEIAVSMGMTNGWSVPDPSVEQLEGIRSVYNALAHDPRSRAHYSQFLWWRLRRTEVLSSKFPVLFENRYFDAPCCCSVINSAESFLDAGGHHGQNVAAFIKATDGNFKHIWTFEPDPGSRIVLNNNIAKHPPMFASKISIREEALSLRAGEAAFLHGLNYASKLDVNGDIIVKKVCLDLLSGIRPTIIRLHVEGSELDVLQGGMNMIKTERPILMVLADHSTDGLYKIANFMMCQKKYKIYFYLHDFCGNSAVFYAIPCERLKR